MVLAENVPGEFPLLQLYRLKRGEDPSRMFCWRGGPEVETSVFIMLVLDSGQTFVYNF
jgi:hypothetical protein